MARLIDWPRDVGWVSRDPVAGPRSVGAAGTEGLTGYVQTTASPFGLLRLQFALPAMNGARYLAWTGFATALHAGANAGRVPAHSIDTLMALGYARAAVAWTNGQPWTNGKAWAAAPPVAPVAAAAPVGETIIDLADTGWGHRLRMGYEFGFMPFHFGVYKVTEWIDAGRYRIWPPLRKALTTDDYATLQPVVAMKLEGEQAANAGRGLVAATGLTVTLIEVKDADVRAYFAD